MDIWSIIVIAARRWYVTIPALVVVALVVFRVADTVSPTAQATATVALLPPSSVAAENSVPPDTAQESQDEGAPPDLVRINPYLSLSSSLMSMADIVRQTLDAPGFRSGVAERGLDGQYEIGVERTSPVIAVSSQADEASVAVRTVDHLVKQMRSEIAELQGEADAPEYTWIKTRVLAQSREAQLLQTNRLRVIASVAALGVVAAIALALVVETAAGIVGRRDSQTTASTNTSVSPLPNDAMRSTSVNKTPTPDRSSRGLIGTASRRGGGYGMRRHRDD